MVKIFAMMLSLLMLTSFAGCEIVGNIYYEDKLSPTQSIKTSVNLIDKEFSLKKKPVQIAKKNSYSEGASW